MKNYIDRLQKSVILNLSWVQLMVARMLQKFLDPVIVSRMIFIEETTSPLLFDFIKPSQLEVTYGGTAPKVTKYWPPTMPDQVENVDQNLNLVKLSDYDQFLL